MNTIVQLFPLECSDREQFILDNQEAFNYGAMEEFGLRDDHFEEEDQIISRDTIEQSIDGGEAYRIVLDGQKVGGIVIKVDGEKGDLDLLFQCCAWSGVLLGISFSLNLGSMSSCHL